MRDDLIKISKQLMEFLTTVNISFHISPRTGNLMPRLFSKSKSPNHFFFFFLFYFLF